jgi:hypothetical protein
MSQARPLSPDDVRGLRDELAAGGTPTLWFTASAVGVPEGRSGKVIALDEPAEGDFIQVRPAGSKDVLSFSTAEVTVVKPPRKRKDATAAAQSGSTTAGSPAVVGSATASGSRTSGTSAAGDRTSKPASSAASSAKPPREAAAAGGAGAGAKPSASGIGTGGARRKPRQPSGATVTLTASPEGQWSVEVNTGKKRVLRPTQVTTSAVAQAAKYLHPEVAEAVEPLLEAAREQQRARVEQLQQELADAQRMLNDLTE